MKTIGTILRHPETNPQQTPSEFRTRDIYVATILLQSGISILRCEGNGRQGIFVFKISEKIESLIAHYFNGELKVDPRRLFESWKTLKSMAYTAIGDVR